LQRRRPQIDGTLDPSVVVLTDAEPDHGLIHLIDEDSDVFLLATDDADEGHLRFLRHRGRERRRRADDGRSRDDRRRETEKSGRSRVARKSSSGIAQSGLALPDRCTPREFTSDRASASVETVTPGAWAPGFGQGPRLRKKSPAYEGRKANI
jgi:hypothetical protein